MISFEVMDMTCGHCVASITRAVQALDAQARVQVDLATHRVDIDGARTDETQLKAAISDAGFTPVRL